MCRVRRYISANTAAAGPHTTTPQMFHLRKPRSLESVSSDDSSSTASTAAMPRTPVFPSHDHHHYRHDARHTRIAGLDPLGLHPTANYCHHQHQHQYQHKPAPPRLADRAFIRADGPAEVFQPHPRSPGTPPGFLEMDDNDAEGQDLGASDGSLALRLDLLLSRPVLARSRWSESTVSTLSDSGSDLDTDMDTDEDEDEDEDAADQVTIGDDDGRSGALLAAGLADLDFGFGFEREARVPRAAGGWENFSYKRNTVAAVPRRRPAEAGNAVDEYVKRGGWKRRGIVFQSGDDSCVVVDRLSSRTVG